MDRTFHIALAVLILCGTASAQEPPEAKSSAAQHSSGPAETELKGALRFPAGSKVDDSAPLGVDIPTATGGTIHATFLPEGTGQAAGKKVTKSAPEKKENGKPGTVEEKSITAPPALKEKEATSDLTWLWVIVAIAGTAGIFGGSLWYYYSRVVPRRELDPYWRALQAIRAGNYRDALPDLTSIETKLPPGLRQDARFFIALCHFHLDDENEAERLAASLHRERPQNETVAYLLAYILVKRKLDTEAEPVLRALKAQGNLGLFETRKLLGIVCFRRGLSALRSGDIERAADLFGEVEELGDWATHIPADLRNRHIGLGTRALFDQDAATARQHFEALLKAAERMPDEEGQPMLAKARIGLALSAWIADDARNETELEALLLESCRSLHPEGATELPWPAPVAGSAKGDAESLKRALEEADRNFNLPSQEKHALRCLRDLHLLRAMVVLRYWARMDGHAANKVIPDRLSAVLSRMACARALDERFADIYLVAGLLMYYLHAPGPERTTGIDLLEEARKLGVRDPDAMEILHNREKIERENADAVDRFYLELDRYLRDETVRKEVRVALLDRLATHRSLMNRYRPPDLNLARTAPPTLQEICDRSKSLRERLSQIGRSPELKRRGDQLQHQEEELARQAQWLEETESELLAITGEELFKDG